MTLRMYASRKKLPLEHVTVELQHNRNYLEDCEGCEDKPTQIEVLERQIELRGDLSDPERERLLEIADRCPVHRSLHNNLQVRTSLLDTR